MKYLYVKSNAILRGVNVLIAVAPPILFKAVPMKT
jgi:hypothetical protein